VVFDYMLKDHAGNVRTVITDEVRVDQYIAATMETAQTTNEELIYAGLPQTRIAKPVNYPSDPYVGTAVNNFVAKVQATAGSQKVGPSITLKVMKGDNFNVRVSSYYTQGTTSAGTPVSPLTDIVNAMIGGVSGSAILNTHGVTSTQLTTGGAFTPDVTQFLTNQTNNTPVSTKPKAYLNWILFDEQFNFVSSSSGAEQVPAESYYGTAPSNPQ
jgi:hypothetical protein